MSPTKKEIVLTRFEYQNLLGYQTDKADNITAKVFEAKGIFSDGSSRILYGIYKIGADSIEWDLSLAPTKPPIDRDNMGIKVKK